MYILNNDEIFDNDIFKNRIYVNDKILFKDSKKRTSLRMTIFIKFILNHTLNILPVTMCKVGHSWCYAKMYSLHKQGVRLLNLPVLNTI